MYSGGLDSTAMLIKLLAAPGDELRVHHIRMENRERRAAAEQGAVERIVAWCGDRTTKENAAIDRVEREISLLREYRTRLIADVVTGKLDVREAAGRLPDDAEEPELLDEATALTEGDGDATESGLDAVSEEVEA